MKNNIKTVAGAVLSALCFLTVFFCCTPKVCAESGRLTHCHTGSRQNGGGCYGTKKTQTRTCQSYNIVITHNGQDYIYVCGQCGNRWSHPNMQEGIRCSGQVTETFYELNCGKNDAAAVSFSCESSTQEWTKELDLTASYAVYEDGISISGFLWNGTPGGESCHVTENGTYTLGLIGSGNVDFSPTISVVVNNIDDTPPDILAFQTVSDAWGQSAELIVNAADAESGLAAEAYSYDGGVNFCSSNQYTVTKNGTYSVLVRDAVGNVSRADTTVSGIDRTSPAISVSTSPSVDNWYDGSLTVTVHAQDMESGLADAPYSFDGGVTYSVGNSTTLSGSGTLEIVVVDRVGNVARLSFRAEKKQRPQPTPYPGSTGGSGTGGEGNTGSGSGTNSTGTGVTGVNNGGDGDTSGTDGLGTGGTDADAAGTGSAGSGTNAGGAGTGSTGSGGNSGAGVSGINGGSAGRGQQSSQGNQGTGGNSKSGGTGIGTSGSGLGTTGNGSGNGNGIGNIKNGKSTSYGADGAWNGDTRSGMTGILPQHYPDGLPRGSMLEGYQNENESGRDMYGNNGTDDAGENGGLSGTDDVNGNDSMSGEDGQEWEDGARVEGAIIQNELLASANEQEAAILQRTGGTVWSGARYGGTMMAVVCVAVLAATILFGWVFLFGIRIDTKDERGHYRFAGITRVTTKDKERLYVVPLTKQIIRNSHTNELRIRFGALSHRRHEGETLLLCYRSIKREFKVQRTVELHIRG